MVGIPGQIERKHLKTLLIMDYLKVLISGLVIRLLIMLEKYLNQILMVKKEISLLIGNSLMVEEQKLMLK
jgi:hypothetical protein